MNIRRVMDSYGNEAHTQGLSTTYLYPANIRKVGHGLEVREGVVWQWGEGEAYSGVPTQSLWGKCPAGMTYHPKEANMS